MSKQLLMYKKIVPLDKQRHRDWSIQPIRDYHFARDLNSVPLAMAEFSVAASEYAIVFSRSESGNGNEMMPVVIMGMGKGDHFYIDEKQGWRARYVPAFVRRYPFVFSAKAAEGQLYLCMDEAYRGFNQSGKGERLFDTDGEQTEYLQRVVGFMGDYQAHFGQTQGFCKRLVELDLMQPMQARVKLSGGGEHAITGFLGVDRSRLKNLPAETLAELVANDWLELIHIHLQSIRTFGLTLDRLLQTSVPTAAELPDSNATAGSEGAGPLQ